MGRGVFFDGQDGLTARQWRALARIERGDDTRRCFGGENIEPGLTRRGLLARDDDGALIVTAKGRAALRYLEER